MDYLNRLRMERPVVYWVVLLVAFWLAFQIALFVIQLLIGPFGLPGWAPLVVLIGGLVLIARKQQR